MREIAFEFSNEECLVMITKQFPDLFSTLNAEDVEKELVNIL